jgi:UDP-N-acetylmuramate dehydrogenase
MTKNQELLTNQFPELPWQLDKVLAPQTYFKIGGPAELYLELADQSQLETIVSFCFQRHVKITMLGGASNVIVSDTGIDGVVLHFTATAITNLNQQVDGKHIISTNAGLKTALLVSQSVALGLTGLEYFLGVPGTVGGAIYNNSHYLNHLIGEHVWRVKVITREGEVKWLTHQEAEFEYDSSLFQKTRDIIMEVEFALSPGDPETSRQLITEATQYRATTQPLGTPNSGCIFQNVPNTDHLRELFPQFAERTHVPGGFLIDQAGLKGHRVGDIEVSEKHAAFFINRGRGTASQVQGLVKEVKERVYQQFKVQLREEVFYL